MPASIIVAGASGTEEQRLAMTISSWIQKSLSDHMTANDRLYRWLKERRRVQRGGVGLEMHVPIKYAMADNARMTGVNDPLVSRTRKIPKGASRLTYKLAELIQTYSIPERETVIQGDATTILNAASTHIELANEQWRADLNAMIWAAETATTSAGDEDTVASIRTLVNKGYNTGTANTFYGPLPVPAQSVRDDGNGWITGSGATSHGATPAGGATAVTTIGGISRSAVDYGVLMSCPVWQIPVSSTGAVFGRLVINQMLSQGAVDSDVIDLMLLDRTLWDGLLGVLQNQMQLQPSKMASYGFTAFRWRDVEFVTEDYMPASPMGVTCGQVLGICSKNLAFVSALEKPKVVYNTATDAPVTDYRVSDYCQLIAKKIGRGLGVRHTSILKPET